jgi:hypothetical protein
MNDRLITRESDMAVHAVIIFNLFYKITRADYLDIASKNYLSLFPAITAASFLAVKFLYLLNVNTY